LFTQLLNRQLQCMLRSYYNVSWEQLRASEENPNDR